MDEQNTVPPIDHEKELLHERQQKLIEILEEIQAINERLQEGYQHDEPSIMMSKLSEFNADFSRVNVLMINAKASYNLARAYWSEKLDPKIQATRFREILDGKTSIEESVHSLAEKTADALKSTIDSMKSTLAFIREEMKRSGY